MAMERTLVLIKPDAMQRGLAFEILQRFERRGLKIAAKVRADGRLADFVKTRYRSWDSGIGAKIEAGKATFADCERHALKIGEVTDLESGRQERLEALFNEFI